MARQRKKTVHGGGTVYLRKSEGKERWVASIKDPMTGKRIQRYATTEKEAQRKLDEIKHEIRQGALATGPRQTVKQFLERWFEDVHKFEVRETTYIVQLRSAKCLILPTLGHIQIQKLTAQHVQNLYADLSKRGVKPGTIRNVNTILHKALKQATRWNLVSRNVCDSVTLPRRQKYQPQMLSKDQMITLLRRSKGHHLETFIWLGLVLGLRNGEMLGLRWSDINLEERTLRVERTLSYLDKRFIEGEPKTKKSKRTIVLPHFLIESLYRHQKRQKARREKAGEAWKDLNLVFCNPRGEFFHPTTIRQNFTALLKRIGFPYMRVHDLRHNASTFLQMILRMPAKLVQDILGHDDLEMTFNYTHSDLDMQREMMDDMDRFFSGLPEE